MKPRENRVTAEEVATGARSVYLERFESEPEVVSWAPGRLEILGNHTDYNGGLVLSVALDLGIAIAAGTSSDSPPRLEAISSTQGAAPPADLRKIRRVETTWLNYPLGVLREIAAGGVELPSLRLAIDSSLPLGAGVSSSAALELATAEAAFELCGGRPEEAMDEAKLCQRAETDFVRMPCGILDQFSSLFGRANHLLCLDCKTLEWSRAPLSDEVALVVADTQVEHELVDGQFARIRGHCEAARVRLGVLLRRPLSLLRDASLEEFESVAHEIDAEDRRRAEHIFRENERVQEGRAAALRGDFATLGRLMTESHASSRDLFGNSCDELDAVVELASNLPGCLGGKLSGGGFGGATVQLVERSSLDRFLSELSNAYATRFETPLRLFVSAAGDGAHVVKA